MEEIVGSTNLNDSPESTPSVQATESVNDFTPVEVVHEVAVAESVVEKTAAEEAPTALPVESVVETIHEVIESKIETPTVETQAESVNDFTPVETVHEVAVVETTPEDFIPVEEVAPVVLKAGSVNIESFDNNVELLSESVSEEMPLKQSITDSTVYQSSDDKMNIVVKVLIVLACVAGAVLIFFLKH